MNKPEALAVLHEILEALKESVVISGVSLDPSFPRVSTVPEGFMIKMLCDLDANSRNQIQPVLKKHMLGIEESKGCIVISSQLIT